MQIGQLARRTGLSASRIRFYEAQGLISVTRQVNGYRCYSVEALAALNIIISAQDAGFTLEEIRRLMSGELSRCGDEGLLGALRTKVDDIKAMEKRLARSRFQIEALIVDIVNRPEGMSHEANTARVLKQFKRGRPAQALEG